MNFAKLPDFAGEAIGDAGGACHCARRHAALRAVTMGKSISVLGASSHTKVAPRPAKTAGFALSNVSSSCREPALAARRTLQDRNETVVIILDQHDVAKWRERAGRVIGPQFVASQSVTCATAHTLRIRHVTCHTTL